LRLLAMTFLIKNTASDVSLSPAMNITILYLKTLCVEISYFKSSYFW
jgi:hypothetical protein